MKRLLYVYGILFCSQVFVSGQTFDTIISPFTLSLLQGPGTEISNDTLYTVAYGYNTPREVIFRTFDRSGLILDSNIFE